MQSASRPAVWAPAARPVGEGPLNDRAQVATKCQGCEPVDGYVDHDKQLAVAGGVAASSVGSGSDQDEACQRLKRRHDAFHVAVSLIYERFEMSEQDVHDRTDVVAVLRLHLEICVPSSGFVVHDEKHHPVTGGYRGSDEYCRPSTANHGPGKQHYGSENARRMTHGCECSRSSGQGIPP